MRWTLVGLFLALGAGASGAAEPPSGPELLESAIAHHDPDGAWAQGVFRLELRLTRPDGRDDSSELVIDNARGRFEIRFEREGDRLQGTFGAGRCEWSLNGAVEISDEKRRSHSLTCERLERMRDYYTYLWGLPMKLRDPGTRVDEDVKETDFEGKPALEMRVTYAESVGSDVWYFYFEPRTSALIGYRFYHDEGANDGEYITLEGLQGGAMLLLPKSRAWYTHGDHRYLGTDILVSIASP